MSSHEPDGAVAGIPLEAHLEELRGRCEAVSHIQGSSTYYHEQLGTFLEVAGKQKLFIEGIPAELNRAPDDEGNEHQVWFLPESGRFLKVTWPGFSGLQVIHRAGEEPKASPMAYMERSHLHNELFGDDVRFLGVLEEQGSVRMMIDQQSEPVRPMRISKRWSEAAICPLGDHLALNVVDRLRKFDSRTSWDTESFSLRQNEYKSYHLTPFFQRRTAWDITRCLEFKAP